MISRLELTAVIEMSKDLFLNSINEVNVIQDIEEGCLFQLVTIKRPWAISVETTPFHHRGVADLGVRASGPLLSDLVVP